MIKLALADDQVLFRRGLTMLLRDLPDVVNAREGYNVTRNEIRFDHDEAEQAKKMLMAMEKIGVRSQPHESTSRTAGYITASVLQ